MKLSKLISIVIFILLLLPLNVFAAWVDTETVHFVIEYQNNPAIPYDYSSDLLVQDVRTEAEKVWDFLKNTMGYTLPRGTVASPANKSQKIKIRLEGRTPGDLAISISTSPPEIQLDNGYTESSWFASSSDILQTTLIHEYLHTVQYSYVGPNLYPFFATGMMNWFWEGTAAWIEDESKISGTGRDTINLFEKYGNRTAISQPQPEISLLDRTYDAMFFYKFLSEKKGQNIVRKILVNLQSEIMAPSSSFTGEDNLKMLNVIIKTVGNSAATQEKDFRNIWKDYTVACLHRTGIKGFQDDGANLIPTVKIQSTYPQPTTNDHYELEYPNTLDLGKKINDCTDGSEVFKQRTRTLPRLAARYYKFNKPKQLDEPVPEKMKTKMQIHVDGQDATYWGAMITGIAENGDTEHIAEIIL